MKVEEVPVTEPVSFDDGRGTLTAPPPGSRPGVPVSKPLDEFMHFLGPTEIGKTVEARFGLYSDASKGVVAEDGTTTPTLVDTPEWVLVVRNTTVVSAGPISEDPGSSEPLVLADHDTVGVFDAQTGDLIVGIEQGAANPASETGRRD
jgi:hypothetical protein